MGVFTMPSLGADMEAGTLIQWLIKPGDKVARGDVVAVVETQKGAIEIEIFEAGEVATLEAKLGQTLPVGAPMARIRVPGEVAAIPPGPPPATPEVPQPRPVEIPSEPEPKPADAPAPELPGLPPDEGPEAPPFEMPVDDPFAKDTHAAPPASPAARARATAAGLTLSALRGSGPGGAILLADVERALATAPPGAAKPWLNMAEMRKAIAAAMVRSKREIPHYYLSQTIDLQPAADWLAKANAGRPPDDRLLIGALMMKATALAVAKTPEVNGRFGADGFVAADAVNAGLVVALRGGGLIAPAIRDAESLTLEAMMAAMRDIVARARSGRLRNSELTTGRSRCPSWVKPGPSRCSA